jgi:hypothetical protein
VEKMRKGLEAENRVFFFRKYCLYLIPWKGNLSENNG